MPITNDSKVTQIWAAIVSALQAEMNVGSGGPGTGTNTTGRLQSLQFVHETIHLWSDELPIAGVQLVNEHRGAVATGHQKVDLNFLIVVAAKAVLASDGTITLDSAKHVLNPLLEDGSGNGVIPVLNDRRVATYGGLANFSRVEGIVEIHWDVDKAVGATDARAYAHVPYIVTTYVEF